MRQPSIASKRFDYWLFEAFSLSPEAWGLFRIAYALYMLLWVGLPELTYLAGLPDTFYHPQRFSIAVLFPGYPPAGILKLLGLLTAVAYLCMLFGCKTRVASVAAAILFVLSKSFVYSTGQINHDFMVWLVPLAGACANWGARYSLDEDRMDPSPRTGNEGWPVTFLVIIFCFALALSGYQKLLGGWADPEITAVQQWHARMFVVVQRDAFLSPFFQQVDSHLFWKSLDYLTLIFEIGILLGISSPRIFRIFLVAAIVFHTMNLLIINIDFSFNFAFYALFLNWERIHRWIEKRPRMRSRLLDVFQWRIIIPGFLTYLLFFGLTESSLVSYILEKIGIGYLGNALVRTIFGLIVTGWAVYAWTRYRSSLGQPKS